MSSTGIPAHLLPAIDTYASQRGLDRVTAVERLLTIGLETSDTSTAPQDLTSQIRAAYFSLAPRRAAYVSLTDLRPLLADIDRKTLDAEILRLHVAEDANLIPEENRRVITPEDRVAAIIVGGEPRHLISISR